MINKFLRNAIGLSFITIAAIYFIPQSSISLGEYGFTLFLIIVGIIFLDIRKDKDAKLNKEVTE